MPKFSANVNGKPYKFDVSATKPYVPNNARTWGSRIAGTPVSKALKKAKA